MIIMKKKHLCAIFFFCLILLVSCQSQEDQVINRLDNLAERIEQNGSKYDVEDWSDALEELADIDDDIQKCDFTKEQLKDLGRVEGKLFAIIMNEGSKAIGETFSEAISYFSSYASGFKEGVEENLNEDDLKETNDEIIDALKAVEQELKK